MPRAKQLVSGKMPRDSVQDALHTARFLCRKRSVPVRNGARAAANRQPAKANRNLCLAGI
jgi:hypothetical protein